MNEKVAQGVELIKGMTVLELVEFKKALEETFGVTAQAPTVAVEPIPTAETPEAVVEEQTEFDAILTEIGEKKLQVIRVVRTLTDLGLKEAKALVDSAPNPIKEKVSREEAEDIKAKLEEVGATVEIK